MLNYQIQPRATDKHNYEAYANPYIWKKSNISLLISIKYIYELLRSKTMKLMPIEINIINGLFIPFLEGPRGRWITNLQRVIFIFFFWTWYRLLVRFKFTRILKAILFSTLKICMNFDFYAKLFKVFFFFFLSSKYYIS